MQEVMDRARWLFQDRLKRYGSRLTAEPFLNFQPAETFIVKRKEDGLIQSAAAHELAPLALGGRAHEKMDWFFCYPQLVLSHLRSILTDCHWTRSASPPAYPGKRPHGLQLPPDFPALPTNVSHNLRMVLDVLLGMREKLKDGAFRVHSYDATSLITLEACLAVLLLLDELSDDQSLAVANQIHKLLHSLATYSDDR